MKEDLDKLIEKYLTRIVHIKKMNDSINESEIAFTNNLISLRIWKIVLQDLIKIAEKSDDDNKLFKSKI